MNAEKKVIVTIPWKGEAETGPKVFKVFVDDIYAAIRVNLSSYKTLEEIRKDLLAAVAHVEFLQARIRFPETMKKPVFDGMLS